MLRFFVITAILFTMSSCHKSDFIVEEEKSEARYFEDVKKDNTSELLEKKSDIETFTGKNTMNHMVSVTTFFSESSKYSQIKSSETEELSQLQPTRGKMRLLHQIFLYRQSNTSFPKVYSLSSYIMLSHFVIQLHISTMQLNKLKSQSTQHSA